MGPQEEGEGKRRRIAVVGGGLAGLAVTYHMLNMSKGADRELDITIFDEHVSASAHTSPQASRMYRAGMPTHFWRALTGFPGASHQEVGAGGASGAMAGILHPLTPRGKLIWMGSEGMKATLDLIEVANEYADRPLRETPTALASFPGARPAPALVHGGAVAPAPLRPAP